MKQLYILKEQGFCFGVSRSISICEELMKKENIKKPVYLLGDLVHNKEVNDYCKTLGIIVLHGKSRLEMLDTIEKGTIIITAHGISQKVFDKATKKGLSIVDATCPYVKKTLDNIKEKSQNQLIVYIGKKDHPEVETVLEEFNNVIVINDTLPIPTLPNKPFLLCHQTTLSDYDVSLIASEIKKIGYQAEILDQVCIFPENRQQELLHYPYQKGKNLIIVIGDLMSNNVTKLYELAKRINVGDVIILDSPTSINDLNLIRSYDYIYLTSGTSTPLTTVKEIAKRIEENKK